METKKIKIFIIGFLIILAIFNIAYVPGNPYVIIFFMLAGYLLIYPENWRTNLILGR